VSLTSVPGFFVGHAEVPEGGSGCTVVLGPFRGAVEVCGMATGTRELDVLSPQHLVTWADAIVLTGGSAFGLAAADGVMEWLAEQGRGFDTGTALVPIVPAAVIYDLKEGTSRPSGREGRRAAESASDEPVREGRVGAGAGATVGKLLGPASSSPGGIGSAAGAWGGGAVGALAVVNALGDVLAADGTVMAGVKGSDGSFLEADSLALSAEPGEENAQGRGEPGFPGTNTTLIVVATDLPLSRQDLGKVARMAASALARAISPVSTPFDGDLVFALSSASEGGALSPRDLMSLGILARDLSGESIRRAVRIAAGVRDPGGTPGHG
jgi:L-aminopeptidase/D-esterase-like protein